MSDPLTPKRIVYADHAAGTPLGETAYAAMLPHLANTYGNPSSLHCRGRQAHEVLETARVSIAETLGVLPTEIIFTGSGTESDNLAITGIARAARRGQHVIVSAIEHKAVLAAVVGLEADGFEVTRIPVDHTGRISIDTVLDAVRDDTTLISIMYANNEIGTTEPIQELAAALQQRFPDGRPFLHTDACQAPGLLDVSPRKLGVDAMTLNSAKVYGPKGIGLLYKAAHVPLEPLIVGGEQEHGLRAGTEQVALAVGFAAALQEAVAERAEHHARMRQLSDHFKQKLQQTLPQVIFNGHSAERLPNNVHISISDLEGESLVLMLDQHGICAATGSACSSHDLEPSHVLTAIGVDNDLIHGSLRFTFGRATSSADIDYLVHVLQGVVKRLETITACQTAAFKRHHTI